MTRWASHLNWFVLVSCETVAQLTLKIAALQSGLDLSFSQWLTLVVTNKWFLFSIACDIASFLAWMSILRRHDLSIAVPLSSLCYMAIVIVAVLVLRETVSVAQFIGLATIGLGIFFLTKDDAVTTGSRPALQGADRR